MKSKQIEGYNAYQINEKGEVYSTKWGKPRKLKPQKASQSKKGYLQVRLYDGSGKLGKLQYVHRLVYTHFVGEIPKGKEIDHIDGDTTNNSVDNIQLLTHRNNMIKYNRKNQGGTLLRDKRDELIKDYEELGTFNKLAEKWGVSITAVNRVVRNRIHLKINGKYGTRTYDETINDEWSL